MSDLLVYLARTSRFGERNASRKLAMVALCNAASDEGHGIVMAADEIAEAAELASVKNAMRLRAELVGVGLISLVTDGDGPLPGQGRGARGEYRINVDRLRQLHEGAWSYSDAALAWRAKRGGGSSSGGDNDRVPSQHPIEIDPVERVLSQHPNPEPEKGAALGAALGAVKGAALGAASPTSSIKESNSYWIDDVPDLSLPGWAIEEVKQLEPERWHVLAEAFLRWKGARKAVDIGKAFIGWSRSVLGISKPGVGKIKSRADWGMVYAMAGISAEEARHGVALPSGAALAARATGDWRDRLRSNVSQVSP